MSLENLLILANQVSWPVWATLAFLAFVAFVSGTQRSALGVIILAVLIAAGNFMVMLVIMGGSQPRPPMAITVIAVLAFESVGFALGWMAAAITRTVSD